MKLIQTKRHRYAQKLFHILVVLTYNITYTYANLKVYYEYIYNNKLIYVLYHLNTISIISLS